jgi:hypothetical protein
MISVSDGIRLLPFLLLIPAAGQQPAILANSGAPIRVAYECSNEELSASGLHCSEEEPCQVYLELSAVESVGARLFLVGNIHTQSITIQSVLLASSDTGMTWSEPFERIRRASLDRIQFFDYATGWISGQIVQPLPRDPFFLLTTDGGATWRRRPVFSESRTGAVESFRFDSATNGTLWIDRSQSGEPSAAYERYESTTGGESWTLREAVARPPAASAEKERDTGWRLRPDEKTHAYRLERRAASRWQPVAAFLIPLATCAPAAGSLPEPAEPSVPAEEQAPPRRSKKR